MTPGELWGQAAEECPDDPVARARRYQELLLEHGHLVRVGQKLVLQVRGTDET